jgi:hypothetical protein
MSRTVAALLAVVFASVVAYTAQAGASSVRERPCAAYASHIPSPAHFAKAIDNPYFPLPVGRTFIYRGVEGGKKELDRMHITRRTKVIAGIQATVVSDNVYEPPPKLLEKTFDYYAQDDRGNVWYLGEDTKELLGGEKVDRSGSWLTGKSGAKPGLIMEADPRVPDAYRQECLSGEAEDLAWVVGRGGAKHLLRTLEFSPLEPSIVERKVYKPGVGVVSEQQLSGGHETLSLVKVTG